MEQIRAFISVELPAQIKEALAQLQDNLRTSKSTSVKWVDPEGIHLTIKFLGNVNEAEIPALTKAISEAVRGVASFSLQLGDPGAFPNAYAPRVVWVGVEGEIEPLLTLHNNIDRVLAPLGFPPEKRTFSPHLTLGRVRDEASPSEKRRLGENVAALKTREKPPFRVESISLMRSILNREGAVYSCLASFALSLG
jgi:2'-5' RNA ligase